MHGGADGAAPDPEILTRADHDEPAVAAAEVPATEAAAPSLFGRGLLYVAIWAVQLAAAVVVFPVLAHLVPAAEFGRLSSAIALSQVLVVLSLVGLDQVLVVLRAQSGNDRGARSLVALGVGLAALVSVVTAVTSGLWSGLLGFAGAQGVVLVTLAWTLPAAGVLLSSAQLLSQDRLKAFSLVNVAYGVGGPVTGMALLVLTGSRTAVTYALGHLGALVVTLVLALVLVRPTWRGAADLPLAGRALRMGLPLMVSSLAVYVLNAGDRLVIQSVLGATEVGRYQIAYNVGNVAILLLGLASAAWAPQISAVRDEAQRWALIARSRDALFRLMVPVVLGMTLGAPLALTIAAPESFRPDELVLVAFLVAAAGFPVLVGNASARELIVRERTRSLAVAAIVAAVVNVGLNVLLLPLWGLPGAAAATIVAFCVQTLLHRLSLPGHVVWPGVPGRLLGAGGLALAVSAVSLSLPQDTAWDLGRFVVALACLPWFLRELRLARAGDGGTVAPPSARPV